MTARARSRNRTTIPEWNSRRVPPAGRWPGLTVRAAGSARRAHARPCHGLPSTGRWNRRTGGSRTRPRFRRPRHAIRRAAASSRSAGRHPPPAAQEGPTTPAIPCRRPGRPADPGASRAVPPRGHRQRRRPRRSGRPRPCEIPPCGHSHRLTKSMGLLHGPKSMRSYNRLACSLSSRTSRVTFAQSVSRARRRTSSSSARPTPLRR